MSFEARTLIALLSPAAIASLFLFVARWGGRSGRWGAAAGSAIGYAAGQWLLLGWPGLPPVDANHSPFFLAPVAAVVAVEAFRTARRYLVLQELLHLVYRLALFGLVGWLVLRPMLANEATRTQAMVWIVSSEVIVLALWVSLSLTIKRLPAPASASALFLPVVALGPLLIFSHSVVLGQMAMIGSSALFPAFVLAWWSRDPGPIRGVLLVALVLAQALVTCGVFYSDGPSRLGIICLLLSPVLAQLAGRGLIVRRKPRVVGVVAAVLVMIPLGIAILLASRSYLADDEEAQSLPLNSGRTHVCSIHSRAELGIELSRIVLIP